MTLPADSDDASIGAAVAHLQAGRTDLAAGICRDILTSNPRHTAALHLLGVLHFKMRQWAEAADFLNDATMVEPDNGEIHFVLGAALAALDDLPGAAGAYARVTHLTPDNAEAHSRLGLTLHGLERVEEAEASFSRALEINPHTTAALSGMAAIYHDRDQLDAAEDCLRRALAINPSQPQASYNLGNVLLTARRPRQAREAFASAVANAPDFAEAHVQMAVTRLLEGDYVAGWSDYEWRWKIPEFRDPIAAAGKPAWNGEKTEGALFLQCEQGAGDTLQFIRFAPMVADRCRRVVVRARSELMGLVGSVRGVDDVIETFAAPGDVIAQAPLMSLPRLFATEPKDIPSEFPYVHADPVLVRQWRQRLAPYPGKKIGLSWRGNPKHVEDRRRSCPLEALLPLLAVPGVSAFSLQPDAPAADQAALGGMIDLTDHLGDFGHTAALIKNLDLVISVDTSVVHLAGALDKPVWVLLSTANDWRWGMEGSTSIWYPSATLFRQSHLGDWAGLAADVSSALARWAGS